MWLSARGTNLSFEHLTCQSLTHSRMVKRHSNLPFSPIYPLAGEEVAALWQHTRGIRALCRDPLQWPHISTAMHFSPKKREQYNHNLKGAVLQVSSQLLPQLQWLSFCSCWVWKAAFCIHSSKPLRLCHVWHGSWGTELKQCGTQSCSAHSTFQQCSLTQLPDGHE